MIVRRALLAPPDRVRLAVIGLALVAVGAAIMSGKVWGRIVGIGLAVVSTITQFLWLPYFPVWAVLVIALDVGVIWALTVCIASTQSAMGGWRKSPPSVPVVRAPKTV